MRKILSWIPLTLGSLLGGYWIYAFLATYLGLVSGVGMLTIGGTISIAIVVGSLIWGGLTLRKGKVGKVWIGLLGLGLALVFLTVSMM